MPPEEVQASGRQRARELVVDIAESSGYLSDGTYSEMLPRAQQKVRKILSALLKTSGSSILTLSKNLYSSSARFVFELLQNADDNSYLEALSRNALPFVSFRVYGDRIVVECKEDGFTPANLTAICSMGESSKVGAQGYIGEKGIGFKSVFVLAWKVLIQSGDFSFYFVHRPGESGMGMVTPIWEDTQDQLPYPLTRITLFLHDTGSDEILAKQREAALQQFRELQATFLLFMKSLRRIEVRMYDDEGEQLSSTTFSMERRQSQVELRRETVVNGVIQHSSQYYHVTKETLSGIPKSENRTYTEAGLADKADAQAEVVLAFPLTQDSNPIIEDQEVFAFLPIRRMGFPFLIQSDFVTDASRQDVVRSSARNIRILNGIGRVFVRAVSQFCDHPTLRYRWMRFLPRGREHSRDTFWDMIPDGIRHALKDIPTLWTRTHSAINRIGDMRRVPSRMLDKNGDPLLPDLDKEEYLAPEYSSADLALLTDYGLYWMGEQNFLARVRCDLDQGDCSIMRSSTTDDDWHSRVAMILTDAWPNFQMEMLALVPVLKRKWKSYWEINLSPVYFPHVNGHQIPTDLRLDLVDPDAVVNPRRMKLFACLGVQEPRVRSIRRRISRHHSQFSVSLRNSRKHLAFLYLTAHLDPAHDNEVAYRDIELVDHLRKGRERYSLTFYFADDDPYGTQALLQPVGSNQSDSGAPALDVAFLHPDYMRDVPSKPKEEARTWKPWLSDKLGVRDAVPLTCSGHLSKECLYVAKHRPEKFLGFLLKHWKFQGTLITQSETMTEELVNLQVLCENQVMYPFHRTYVRTADLAYVNDFLRPGEFFPWLKQDASISDRPEFSSLEAVTKALRLGYPRSELGFYLTILRFIVLANNDATKMPDPDRLYDLYGRIEARYHESKTPSASRELIRQLFKSTKLIYVPAYGGERACWASPGSCRWEAPAGLICNDSLMSRYSSIEPGAYITEFFRNTLGIPDADVDDYLEELRELKNERYVDFDYIHEIYQRINEERPEMSSSTAQKVREHFETHAFIYYNGDGVASWCKPSECLWSTATDIDGMTALNNLYEDLADFFVEFLGVRTLTSKMLCDKLIEQGRQQLPIANIKESIHILNSLLEDEDAPPSPKRLLGSQVFPVTYPRDNVQLCTSEVHFAIADRKDFLELFSGKAKFLDFDVNDILRMEPFLRWAGMETRYLSSSVKEISSLCDDLDEHPVRADRRIAKKARALLRVAVQFKSPRARKDQQAFYKSLTNIDFRVHLNQDGDDIKVEISRSELHLQEDKNGLTIYVPRNKQTQYVCFIDRLPSALLEWMLTEPSTGICDPLSRKALSAMQMILQAPDNAVALTLLDRNGILSVEVPGESGNSNIRAVTPIGQAPVERDDTSKASSDGNEDSSTWETPISMLSTPPVALNDVLEFGTPSRATHASSRHAFTFEPSPTPNPSRAPEPGPANQSVHSEYRQLLDLVVAAARAYVFPSRGPIKSNDGGDASWLRNLEKVERDRMIGAAGELFAFEVLSLINPRLPGFTRANWESTVRKYVSFHPDYRDLEPWNGRETADITYDDDHGVLTVFLMTMGYLKPSTWVGRLPRYYIEVKSTTSSWDVPFYMSKYQFERMQRCSPGETGSGNLDSIYLILRVFNLGKPSAGIKVYAHPELMREKGKLVFTGESWSVVPGPRSNNSGR